MSGLASFGNLEAGRGTVTITLGVRLPDAAPGQAFTCPLPSHGTPFTIHLSEALGSRTLLDGGRVPPAPPTSTP